MDKNQILLYEMIKEDLEDIGPEERYTKRKDFNYSKLYEIINIEDIIGNILPVLRYFDYPFIIFDWAYVKEHFKDSNKISHSNAILQKYLAKMDLPNFKMYRFKDSSYLLTLLFSQDWYLNEVKRTCPSMLEQYSLSKLANQVNFLTSLPDFSEKVLFEYLEEVNRKS